MVGSWLIGERHESDVQLFLQCGLCKLRMPLDDGDDARELLAAHLYCEHGARPAELDAQP